jgi:hypothetical protein
MKIFALLVTSVSGLAVDYPFYHSTDFIHAAVDKLKTSCAVPFTVSSHACGNGGDCIIDVVDIGDNSGGNKRKVFYLFGEHARELVSPETALQLMKDLCSPNPTMATKAALQESVFRIIPNGNPGGRRMVESGQYCLRSNPNGVDLNRNWDANWKPKPVVNDDQLNPGPRPFSEKETLVFRNAVSEFMPNVFAAIHSGTLGMYMPWAFQQGKSSVRNGEKMTQVLQELDDKFCKCPAGGAEKEVGYSSPGTCLDWVHTHLKTDYSFAFEIFTGYGVDELRDRYRLQRANLRNPLSSMLQLEQEDSCFMQFNPRSEESLTRTINNWSDALVELALLTARK